MGIVGLIATSVVCLGLFLSCVAASAQGADLSPDELLAAYERSFTIYERGVFAVETRITYSGFALPAGTVIEEGKTQLWRDADRWKYITSAVYHSPLKGKVHESSSRMETVYPARGMVIVILDPVKEQKVQAIVARLDDLPVEERSRIGTLPLGLATHGFINGNGRLTLPAVLKQSKLSARREQVDSRDLWVLEGTGPFGQHTLWLDPALGFLPRRIVQRKAGTDWFERGRVVNTCEGDGRYWPRARYTETSRRMDALKFEKMGNSFALTEFTIVEESHFADGRAVALSTNVRFSKVDLAAIRFAGTDPFVVSTPIPNGTPVQVDDHPTISFRWQDGQIIKDIERDSVEKLSGHSMRPGTWLGHGTLSIGALSLLGLVAIAWARWHWRS
jgi:hypothetical protein